MNIIEGLQQEIKRVNEIIEIYESVPNNAGAFAAGMMKFSVRRAEEAIAFGDTVGMIQSLKDLQEYNA